MLRKSKESRNDNKKTPTLLGMETILMMQTKKTKENKAKNNFYVCVEKHLFVKKNLIFASKVFKSSRQIRLTPLSVIRPYSQQRLFSFFERHKMSFRLLFSFRS